MTAQVLPFRARIQAPPYRRFDSDTATEQETAAFLAQVQDELRAEAELRGLRLNPYLSLAS